MTNIESLIIDRIVDIKTEYAMELTVEELIEQLQEIKDPHKNVYVEQNDESLIAPVIGIDEKHYGVIIKC